MLNEETRTVVGFVDYICTRDGRIMNRHTQREKSQQINTISGIRHVVLTKPTKPGAKEGYRYAYVPVTRIMWQAWIGKIPRGLCVAHKDGDRDNCHIDNLWLTPRGASYGYPGDEVVEMITTVTKRIAEVVTPSNYDASAAHVRSRIKNVLKNIGGQT